MSTATYESLAHSCDALNALLQGELAAVETYTRAIGLFDDQMVIGELQKIRDEHHRGERELRDQIVMLNGVPANGPGLWAAFAAVAGPALKVLGCATVLAALRQGEEQAIGAYEDTLNHEDIHPDSHRLISGGLLVAARRHVDELNRLLGGTC